MSQSLYNTKVSVKAGRAGHARSGDGLLDLPFAMPKAFGGPENGTNPEQLFAAAFGACFGTSFQIAANGLGVKVSDIQVEVEVGVYKEDPAYTLAVQLQVIAPEVNAEQSAAILDAAHGICAYSNALRGNAKVSSWVNSPVN